MLPIQQQIQFPQAEINSTQNNALSLQKSVMPIMQISNVQEQPSTSKKTRLTAGGLGAEFKEIGKQRQREILTSLLSIMLEQEKFVHYQDQIVGMGHARASERFSNLELVSAAIRAENALLCMKTHAIELLASKKEGENKRKRAREGIATALISFCKSGLAYYQFLNEITNEMSNLLSEQRAPNKKGYAPIKKEKAEKTLKMRYEIYEDRCKKRKVENHQVTDFIKKYLHEIRFTSLISKIFCALSSHEIEEIIQASETRQVATLNSLSTQPVSTESATVTPTLCTSAEQPNEFAMLRKPVSENFWHMLKKRLTKEDFIKQFYQFVNTNWNNDYETEKALKKSLLKAKKENDLKERYQLLSQRWFQKKLKSGVIKLLYHILKIKEYQLELDELYGSALIEKNGQLNYSANRVNGLAEEYYNKYYMEYQKRKNEPTLLTEKKLKETAKKCANVSRDVYGLEKYVNLNMLGNIKYINSMLNLLKKQIMITSDISKKYIFDDQGLLNKLNKQPASASKVSLGKRPYHFSEHQPPQKEASLISFEPSPAKIVADTTIDDTTIDEVFWKKYESEIGIEAFYTYFSEFIQLSTNQHVQTEIDFLLNTTNIDRVKYFIEFVFKEDMRFRKAQILSNILKIILIEGKLYSLTIDTWSYSNLIEEKGKINKQTQEFFCNTYNETYLKYQNWKKIGLDFLTDANLQNLLAKLNQNLHSLKKINQNINIDDLLIQKYRDKISAIAKELCAKAILQTQQVQTTPASTAFASGALVQNSQEESYCTANEFNWLNTFSTEIIPNEIEQMVSSEQTHLPELAMEDLQPYLHTELDDFNDPELVSSLDSIPTDNLYQL